MKWAFGQSINLPGIGDSLYASFDGVCLQNLEVIFGDSDELKDLSTLFRDCKSVGSNY